jgi:hypothetical protein
MHFWDPMDKRAEPVIKHASGGVATAHAGGFIITAITTTTRMRGASG